VLSIWAYELARDSLTRVSFGSDDHNVAWSPDGKRVAFESGRAGVHQVYIRPADGSGEAEQITTGDYDHYLCDWSPDGRTIAYVEYHPDSGADLWLVDLEARQPRALLNSRFYEKQATFSPNGRWLAYATDDSGRYEVYVQPFPGPGSKWLVSTGGGEEPAWSRSGQEIFFRSGGRMMAATVSETPEFSTSKPEVLFEGLYHYSNFPTRSYDIGPDGRFVMVAEPEPEFATRKLEVVLNWSEELKQEAR
jgi:Tol biopolymer transport system component